MKWSTVSYHLHFSSCSKNLFFDLRIIIQFKDDHDISSKISIKILCILTYLDTASFSLILLKIDIS